MKTNSHPHPEIIRRNSRTRCLSLLFALFRRTADPTFRLAVYPTFELNISHSLCFWRQRTRRLDALTRNPLWDTLTKSDRFFMTRTSESIGNFKMKRRLHKKNYAQSLLRPFARLAERTFLPPTVDILAKNPCLLFRTRLLGWYVRFIFH